MCDVIAKAYALGMSRRAFLGKSAIAAGGAATGLAALPAVSEAIGPKYSGDRHGHGRDCPPSDSHTRLVLLGTAAAPTWWLGSDRAGISSAVAVGDSVYLVDLGDGWGARYRQSGLGPEAHLQMLDNLKGVFFTHLHSDHTIDYNDLLVWGSAGYLKTAPPVAVYGPGDRGSLPKFIGAGSPPPVFNPDDPTPGTESMTEYIYKAYATDINDRIFDANGIDPHAKVTVHDIPLPPEAGSTPTTPPPRVSPFLVFEDESVKVTATLVDHGQVWPSFAFRFDSDDGAIVFSGDTAPSDNLVELAQGADILVHEVIDRAWVESQFGTPPFTPAIEAIVHHLLGAHTTMEQVGEVAERAGVETLVLSHLAPANNPTSRWQETSRYFSGRTIVGEDLLQVGVGTRKRGRHKPWH